MIAVSDSSVCCIMWSPDAVSHSQNHRFHGCYKPSPDGRLMAARVANSQLYIDSILPHQPDNTQLPEDSSDMFFFECVEFPWGDMFNNSRCKKYLRFSDLKNHSSHFLEENPTKIFSVPPDFPH